MNSRKKRFWKLWQKRNEEIAVTNVEKANKIRYFKFLGEPLPKYIQCFDHKNKVMKAEEIITRIRKACDAIYEKYEVNPLIEKDDIIAPFEDIINDYYEDLSPM